MRRVYLSKVAWQNERKTLTLFDADGLPWGQIYLPKADDRALFVAARALTFAIEGDFSGRDRSKDHADNRGRSKGQRNDRRRADKSRPDDVALRDPSTDNVEGAD
jgi:hypothetical protein